MGWCSQSEAAQKLTEAGDPVSQQQISRYLSTWPEIPRKAGENGQPTLVDFAALKAHRAQNIRVQEKTSAKSSADDDDSTELRRRERLAATELRELELAKARDEVIPRAAVERAIQAASIALQQSHRRSRFERAEALEATKDTRAKVALLTDQDTHVEAAFAQALASLAAPKTIEEEERAAEEQEIEEAKIADQLTEAAPPAPLAPASPIAGAPSPS